MSIRTKLVTLLLLPTLAFLYFSTSVFVDARGDYRAHSLTSDLTEAATHMSAFVHECQKERGYTAGFLGSNGTKFSKELPKQRQLADEMLASLQTFFNETSSAEFPTEYSTMLRSAIDMAAQRSSIRSSVSAKTISTKDAIGYYTSMNAMFLDLIAMASSHTNDDQLARELSGYANFLKSKERAGIERAVLSNTFALDRFGPGMHTKLVFLIGAQDNYMDSFLSVSSDAAQSHFTEASIHPSFAEVSKYRDTALAKATEGSFGESPESWFEVSSARINQLKQVEDSLSDMILERASMLQSTSRAYMFIIGIAGLAVISVTAFGGFLMLRLIITPIREAVSALNKIADGDLTHRLQDSRKDEIGQIAISANRMTASLASLIRDVISSSHDVASAATEVSANAEEISAGIDEQSSNLNQVSAAVEQMNASIIEVASKSAHAESLASNSGDQAQSGAEVVGLTVSGIQSVEELVNKSARTVGDLGERSIQIGEIINTINDIADQTNLLALNAAIEAARAGEHGRGFAVVADEVRKLAERTTSATSEVSESINEIQSETKQAVNSIKSCQSEMATGVSFAKEAGESLSSILDANAAVNTEISGIAAATDEQSAACSSISENIENISGLIERSSEGVRESATASAMLSTSAEELQSLVTRFRVD